MDGRGDAVTTLANLRAEVESFVRERDWEQFHSPKNLSMALAIEAAELMDHYKWAESISAGESPLDPAIVEEVATCSSIA